MKWLCWLLSIPSAYVLLYALPSTALDQAALEGLEQRVIAWRRDFHQHPELSNREFRTAARVATHLRSLNIEVTTGVAHTGVVGIMRGGHPGPVVALRADMDALPVTETVDLPFSSRVRTTYMGEEVGVMHACGHDAHTAILMGVAELLSSHREQMRGTVKFIFQPAEEGAPEGEEGGANLMVQQGVLESPAVDVIFGLHVMSDIAVNTIGYRSGGIMASSDDFRVIVRGSSSHASAPWGGIDPITTSAHIITNLQTIVSRNLQLTKAPAVVSVGGIRGGVRNNIIPDEVEFIGTIRTLEPDMRDKVQQLFRQKVTLVADSMGASVQISLPHGLGYPVTYNNPPLVNEMLPILQQAAGSENVRVVDPITGSEDFSFYAQRVPGFFFFLGGRPPHFSKEEAPSHHRSDFYIDESGFILGVKALADMTLAYQNGQRGD